jgi:capsular polysaccharide biosynthesis protein
LSDRFPAMRDLLLGEYRRPTVERLGILHGDYVLLGNGTVLVDPEGSLTVTCSELGASVAAGICETPDLKRCISNVVSSMDSLILLPNCVILTDPWADNYFHFSLSVLPRLRHFESVGPIQPVMPPSHRSRPFQLDLLERTLRGVSPWPISASVRVRDPILAHDGDQVCRAGARWLSPATGIAARPGRRRVYVRRSAGGTRLMPGGAISESPGFLALLRDFGFETIEFGSGQHSVAAQVAMLEGAGVVLAAHGASQTNLAYLRPDLLVIEVFGALQLNACFMRMCAWLGFDYHGILSAAYDEAWNIIVDPDELRDVLRARLRISERAEAAA